MGNSSSLPLRARRRHRLTLSAVHSQDALSPPEMQYLKPNGLYPTCQWDPKTVRRLILRHELAPRHPGIDEASESAREECPICMLVYPVLNETRCCHARLCTECYLQIRPPRHNKEPCPFCKYKRVEASYKGPRDKRDMDREELEEKQAADAMKRATLAAAAAAAAAASGTSSTTRSSSSAAAGSPQSGVSNCDASGSSGAGAVATVRVVRSGGASTSSEGCLCANKAGSQAGLQAGPLDEFSSRYYHDKAPAIDPLLLEAMASEVTYASAAGCAGDRGSGSSSGRLEMHMGEVQADGGSSAEQESVSYLAEVGHRIIRLPWHGADVDRSAVGSGMVSTGVSGRTQGRISQEERMQHEEKLSLREAIRRSLIEM